MSEYIDIVFNGPPGPVCGRFVEVEDDTGASIGVGEWIETPPFWRLRIQNDKRITTELQQELEVRHNALRTEVGLRLDLQRDNNWIREQCRSRGWGIASEYPIKDIDYDALADSLDKHISVLEKAHEGQRHRIDEFKKLRSRE